MILSILIITSLFLIVFGVSKLKKKTKQVHVEVPDKIEPSVSEQTSDVEQKIEKVEESVEEMAQRLKEMVNPDMNKPFAKISTPEISEIPSNMEATEPAPEEEPKRRKSRKPKTESLDENLPAVELPDQPKKRTYKKREKK